MTKRTEISDDDKELFRNTIGDIDRIHHDQVLHVQPKPAPVTHQSKSDKKIVLEEIKHKSFAVSNLESGDEIIFRRAGIQKAVLEKLRRGQYMIQAELDLHGLTVLHAKKALREFLKYCINTNKLCVRIIHGKGYGSNNRLPILKNELNVWLKQQENVLAFCSAHPNDGGTGAVYVLIKKH